jgi:hypothetical protein
MHTAPWFPGRTPGPAGWIRRLSGAPPEAMDKESSWKGVVRDGLRPVGRSPADPGGDQQGRRTDRRPGQLFTVSRHCATQSFCHIPRIGDMVEIGG